MSWDRIRGHDPVIRFFRAAAREGRIGHAYLFTGPAGVGKGLFARELARALLCEKSSVIDLVACGACAACRQVDAGTHPDLTIAGRPEESLELPIEVVRELCASLTLKPMRGGRKIGILEDADDLNDASANAFLKTLEEPPPGSVLILIGGGAAETQLPTIVSRCQIVRFAPLPGQIVAELLANHGIAERTKVDRLVRLGGGSIGQALALEDETLWTFRENLVESFAAERVDTVQLGEQWQHFVEEAGKEAAAQRRRGSLLVRLLIELLQSALRAALGSPISHGDVTEAKAIAMLANRLGAERLLTLIERCLTADQQIDRRVQLVLVLEALSAAFAPLAPAVR